MSKSLRILILEDNPADAELAQFELETAGFCFTAKVVMTEEEFVHELQAFPPDLILSDYDLPRYNGALALAETKGRCPDTPFILVTGAVSEDRAIEILTQGAKDYVLKTRLQQRLAPAVRRALAEAEEHRARKHAENELHEAYRTLERLVKERTSELQESREHLSLALTSSRMGIFEWDIVKNRRYFDDYVYLLLGIKPENFSGTAAEFFQAMHPDDRLVVQEALKKAIDQDTPYETEYRAVWPDDSVHHIAVRGKVQRDSAGRPLRLLGVCWEITERRRVEEKLNRQAQLLNLSSEAIFMWELGGVIIYWSHGAERLYGYTSEEAVGRVSHDLLKTVHPQGSDSIEAMLTQNASWAGELLHITKDGTRVTVESRHQLIKDDMGRQIVLETTRDITERKQVEEALRKSEGKYRNLVKYAPAVIYEMDLQGTKFYSVNEAMCNTLMYTREELLSIKPADLLNEEGRSLFKERVRKKLAGERIDEAVEYLIRRKDGEWIHTTVNMAAYTYADEKSTRVVVIAYDITEQKKAEKALQERTQQLEEANRELESFSYSVSHDLKAPLRAIEGYSRILVKKYGETLGEDAAHMVGVIRNSTEKMVVLIDDLLSFSRVLKSSMTFSDIDMDKLASDVWDDIRTACQERELDVKVAKLLPGFGDRALIRQVLFNLFSNAVKFTNSRKPGIIEVSSYLEPGSVVYRVKDNGVGFDMAYYDKLFGVFQRLHSQEEYEGTGVGLAIVQRIVQRHGGRVWAEGEVDKGAAFYFALPGK